LFNLICGERNKKNNDLNIMINEREKNKENILEVENEKKSDCKIF
jgi:hypothetical protein